MLIYISSSQEEKDKWIEDLNEAIIAAKNRIDDKLKYASLKSSTSKFIANDKLNSLCTYVFTANDIQSYIWNIIDSGIQHITHNLYAKPILIFLYKIVYQNIVCYQFS